MSEHTGQNRFAGSTPQQRERIRRLAEQPAQYGAVTAAVFALAWGVFFWLTNDVSVAVAALSATIAGVLFAAGMVLWARWAVRRSDDRAAVSRWRRPSRLR